MHIHGMRAIPTSDERTSPMPEEAPVMSTTFPLRFSFLNGFTNAHTNSFTGTERGMYTKTTSAALTCISTLCNRT